MATKNPFLQSPFDAVIEEADEDTALLQGQLATKKLNIPAVKAAPKAPAADQPDVDVAPKARRATRADNYLPPDDLRPIFESAAQKYDVPANVIMALAHQESRYNSRAVGVPTQWGRAKGMLQYIDDTAAGMGINAFDAAQSIDAAAKQIRQRLDNGSSMIDAVKEHFAGPNRKLWGEKTEVYGREVMEKVGKIGSLLMGTAQAAEPDSDIPKDWIKLTPEQAAEYEVKQPTAAAQPTSAPAEDEEGFLEEWVTNPLSRGWKSMKRGLTASGAMFDARQLEVIGRIDRGETVPDQDDTLGYQHMDAAQRAEAKKMMGDAFKGAVEKTTALGKEVQAIPQDPVVAAAANAKSFDEWWTYFKQKPLKFIANTGVESLPNMVPGLVLGGGAGLATQATLKTGGLIAGAAGMGAGSYAVDYPATVLSALQEMNIDTNDPDALARAFADPKIMDDVRKQAHAHASVVGTLDAVSGAVAGKTLVAGKGVAKRALNVAAQTGAQGALGAAGEAGGQVAQGKDDISMGAVMSEFAGEMAGAPVEAAGAAALKAKNTIVPPQPAAEPAAAPAMDAPPVAPPSAPAPAPSQEVGPLSRSAENAAEQTDPPQRVTVTMPEGQVGGTLQGYQEDADGNFTAEIVDDNGEVRLVSSADGVQLTPEAPADPGPLTTSLSNAAEAHAADPAPVPERPAPPPGPPDYSEMDLPALRERMKYIAQQAKASGGMNKMFMEHRKAVEKAINTKVKEAKEASKLSEEPLSAGPFDDRAPANKMALRMAESTGTPHEVIEKKGKFTVQPIQEVENGNSGTNDNGRGRGDRDAALDGAAVGIGPVPAGAAGRRAADGGPGRAVEQRDPTGDAGASPAVINPSALTATTATEQTNVSPATTVSRVGDEHAPGAEKAAKDGANKPRGRAGNRNPGVDAGAGSGSADPGVGPGVPDADAAADGQPALKDKHAGKLFSGEDKADAYILKHKLRATHRVEQTGRVRFEVKPKKAAPRADGRQKALDAEAKLNAQIEVANQKASARAKEKTGNPMLDNPASWVIREKATGKVMLETFDRKKVDALNTNKYEAVPAAQHLAEINDPESAAGKAARATDIDAAANEVATSPSNDLAEPAEAQVEAAQEVAAEQTADVDVDTGADIPRAFFRKVKVPVDVWIEDERAYETVEMPADKALASVREDITNLRSLVACMKG